MGAPAPRVLVVGLDSMDPDLILRWADAGVLPTFGRLRDEGTWGPSLNPPRRYSGAMWPSFVTGTCPHRHGRYFRYQALPGSHRAIGTRAGTGEWPPVWEAVSRAGGRVAVINVPYTPLSRDLAGVQVSSWAMHDFEHDPVRTWPPALAADLLARFDDVRTENCDVPHRSARDFVRLRDRLVAQVEMKARYALRLLAHGAWDLFMIVFDESHCVGHQGWHLHDPVHPRHEAALARAVGDPIRDVYAAIDHALGAILRHAGPGTTRLVLASHGMGPFLDVNFLLDRILWRLGLARSGLARRLLARAGLAPIGPPARVPHHGDPVWTRLGRRAREAFVTWGRRGRFAYALWPVDGHGRVRLNVARADGQDSSSARAWLADRLRELVDAETGRPLVADVAPMDGAEGYLGDRPDLVVRWAQPTVRAVRSPVLGTIEQRYRGNRTGDHRRHGLFFLARPGEPPRAVPEPWPVTDFAPVIAATLGAPWPPAGPPDPPCPVCRSLRD
jgi:predicted AlkP superfamily phosphohydrolase/phosphomutase